MSFPPLTVCKHCEYTWRDHAALKCLFAPTTFEVLCCVKCDELITTWTQNEEPPYDLHAKCAYYTKAQSIK